MANSRFVATNTGGDMSIERKTVVACAAIGVLLLTAGESARGQQSGASQRQAGGSQEQSEAQTQQADGPMASLVREATEALRDTQAATAAGYALASGCVSGPEEGAMGVHYGNAELLGDALLDVTKPEVLVFEPRNGRLQLVAAEYVVIAEQWHKTNEHPPVLNGQHFHYVPAPNRAGLPAHYELHVWAWKRNPRGTFADWNPRVSCDDYNPQ
jgi:hypothetical protein